MGAPNQEIIRTRSEAIETLARYGIHDAEVYLIDVIPLVEMVWADGHTQDGELQILDDYLQEHVAHMNAMAGFNILSMAQARKFVQRFVETRPDPELLKALRELIAHVRLSSSDEAATRRLRQSMLAACIDIAASSVTQYPYPLRERFNFREKQCFFEILDALA